MNEWNSMSDSEYGFAADRLRDFAARRSGEASLRDREWLMRIAAQGIADAETQLQQETGHLRDVRRNSTGTRVTYAMLDEALEWQWPKFEPEPKPVIVDWRDPAPRTAVNMAEAKSFFMNTQIQAEEPEMATVSTKEVYELALRQAAQRLAEYEAETALFGDEPDDGSILLFDKSFEGNNEFRYRYVAFKTDGGWYLTGARNPGRLNWDSLMQFMKGTTLFAYVTEVTYVLDPDAE